MKKIIRLTENDLSRIVRRVIKEENSPSLSEFAQQEIKPYLEGKGYRVGSDGEEGGLMSDLGLTTWKNTEEGRPAITDKRYYGDGLALVLMTKF